MQKRNQIPRLLVLSLICVAIALGYTGRLLYLQVSGQDYYSMSSQTVYRTRTAVIQARRGEIFDRSGVPLVVNSEAYDLYLDYQTLTRSDEELNEMLLEMTAIAARSGEEACILAPKEYLPVTVRADGLDYVIPDGFSDTAAGRRYFKLIDELNVKADAPVEDHIQALMLYYGILAREQDPITKEVTYYYRYTYDVASTLFARRLDMTLTQFAPGNPYKIAEDVSLAFITGMEELYSRGFTVQAERGRSYCYPGYLSHILGYVGSIPGESADYYTERGYALNATVGRAGCESAFEEYLHGTDGTLSITEDGYGNVVSTEVVKEPVAGRDVYLTVDINMQIVAENALARNIARIREEANPYKALTGEDASAGGLTVIDPDNNEILAIASYPTYNLALYAEDSAYRSNLIGDTETSPMLNRALMGGYAPGSTFKIGVATAALMEKTITKDTIIDAQGQYMYYADTGYTPRCWLYLLTGQVHGKINVVTAIQESCNYFFFDVGRRLTIQKMNEYCRHYGLGEHTGIELPESTGILAGPDYRSSNGLLAWGPGDTLQAAIGQSDNLFTPLQLACYLSTVLNKGTRYEAHILKEIRDFRGEEPVWRNETVVADEIKIPDDILNTVREGMKGVMDLGSAATVFADYDIPVGGKTGTAQVHEDRSDNGIMIAFAPFDKPELIVTCVIEQASGGTETGYSIRDIFDYYFNVDEIRARKAAEEAEEAARIAAEEAERQAAEEAYAAYLAEQERLYQESLAAAAEAANAEPVPAVPQTEIPADTAPLEPSIPAEEPAGGYVDDGSAWLIDIP
ncbi:MAG: hypothetical protein II768_03000 [Clostridia bacterium]|nr:hypothetical protein [Clostridia bacterium]